eukprot:CAMPEP_0116125840 /NCGR_PEP_ID=MMETSP0329-20121206/6019_1 /TAXON_ID=697910 /ORGANISM="Pseudo-nitzschia arenysensis, Strain B593" /LENGTH=275 /DNA_ID=CAMNT_0003619895 /DNA_START=62 /DNA_END=890 /DNA_ORIENTATION=+
MHSATTIRSLAAVVLAIFCNLLSSGEAFAPKYSRVSRATRAMVSSTATKKFTLSNHSPNGLLDNFLSRFGNNDDDNDDDEGDFVKLESMNEQFMGPGPVVLLYKIPDGIVDDEVRDILEDGAPSATKRGISIARIPAIMEGRKLYSLKESSNDDGNDSSVSLIDLSLEEALETVMKNPPKSSPSQTTSTTTTSGSGSPVVIFSGFSNQEMMASYNILGEEIYKETAGYGKGEYLACATAVPNAMNKPLRQVLEEISGDHAEAMSSSSSSSSSSSQ